MHRPTAVAIVTLLIPLGFSEETRGQADPEERPLIIDYGYSYPTGMGNAEPAGPQPRHSPRSTALPGGLGRGSSNGSPGRTIWRPPPSAQTAQQQARATASGNSSGWSMSEQYGPPEQAPPAEPVPLLHRPGMRYFVQSQATASPAGALALRQGRDVWPRRGPEGISFTRGRQLRPAA